MIKTILPAVTAIALALSFAPASHANEGERVTVYKTPWCGCCEVWTKKLKSAGFTVTSRDMEDLDQIKRQALVPEKLEACHTATMAGYVLEGHVPLQAIDKLLTERPRIIGISVPGMPSGSLGMGYDADARYTVYSYSSDANKAPVVFYEAGK